MPGLIVFAGASGIAQSTPEELLAAARVTDDTFGRLMVAIGDVVQEKAKLEKSNAALAQKKQLLLREFKGLNFRSPATYKSLYDDLVAFRQDQLLLSARNNGLVADAYGRRACEGQKLADAQAAEILSS